VVIHCSSEPSGLSLAIDSTSLSVSRDDNSFTDADFHPGLLGDMDKTFTQEELDAAVLAAVAPIQAEDDNSFTDAAFHPGLLGGTIKAPPRK